ncbi:MAG: hypothetical protein RLZZ301_1710 [Bacteroidota bacterium]|jgi:hypothetical protein
MTRFVLFCSLFYAVVVRAQVVQPPYTNAFLQNELASVYIDVAPDSLALILGDSLYSGYTTMATMHYQSSVLDVVIDSVGFRCRGNTSLASQKKSFKIDLNQFVSGQKFVGLKEINLNGEHNDPSIMRTYTADQLLRASGLPASRTSYVRLYINNEYKGLYINVEYLDGNFLDLRFPNDGNGNLWKCYYGADLTWLGTSASSYQNNYILQTNESANDYTALIHFIDVLNHEPTATFACAIQEVFDVELFLRNIALEILIGQWDGYAYNKNNYYLYQRPSDGKIVFMSYDLDNTFGIDWFGINWALRNVYSWSPSNSARPLYTKLLAVPYFRDRFTYHLNDILTNVWNVSALSTQLSTMQSQILAAAQEDTYKGLDYGFTNQDFSNALNQAWGAHVTSGIIPYLQTRKASAQLQLSAYQGLLNPCVAMVENIEMDGSEAVFATDLSGRQIPINQKNTMKLITYKNGTIKCVYEID